MGTRKDGRAGRSSASVGGKAAASARSWRMWARKAGGEARVLDHRVPLAVVVAQRGGVLAGAEGRGAVGLVRALPVAAREPEAVAVGDGDLDVVGGVERPPRAAHRHEGVREGEARHGGEAGDDLGLGAVVLLGALAEALLGVEDQREARAGAGEGRLEALRGCAGRRSRTSPRPGRRARPRGRGAASASRRPGWRGRGWRRRGRARGRSRRRARGGSWRRSGAAPRRPRGPRRGRGSRPGRRRGAPPARRGGRRGRRRRPGRRPPGGGGRRPPARA